MGFLGSGGLRLRKIEVRGRHGVTKPLTLLHLSDLHGQSFGPGQSHLLRLLKGLQPDAVFLTGDVLDEHTRRLAPVEDFLSCLPKAPAFFVPGNHDPACPLYPKLRALLERNGIEMLVNRARTVDLDGLPVKIVGLDDLYHGHPDLGLLEPDEAHVPVIVAAHSPTLGKRNARRFGGERSLLVLAARQRVDLILCGHTHGGQVRLPWIGAVYAPGQPVLPSLAYGVYTEGHTSMYITSGLGTSHLPVRFLCPPEAALITWCA